MSFVGDSISPKSSLREKSLSSRTFRSLSQNDKPSIVHLSGMQMKLNNIQGFIYSLSQKNVLQTPPSSSRGGKKSEATPKPLAIAAGGFSNK